MDISGSGARDSSMFQNIPQSILERMQELERIDAEDRTDGTPPFKRLRQIPADTGRFLAMMVAAAPAGEVVEIGTSAGYSTLWLSLAGRPITTFEVLPGKVALASHTFKVTGLGDQVRVVEGDVRDLAESITAIAFCFLDADKGVYADCYELIVPRLVPGGLLIADNVISHREELQPVIDRALRDERVDTVVVPIGKGELVCRRAGHPPTTGN